MRSRLAWIAWISLALAVISGAAWLVLTAFPTEFIAREACAANLLIIGRERLSEDPFRSLDPGALLLKVGRPILLVPTGLDRSHANRVAVAWKDTREARRALSDTLPFLHDAEKVFLVEVCAENYLSRHRITTTIALMLQDRADDAKQFVRDVRHRPSGCWSLWS